ncbi:MAG: hypothetical protein AB7S77_24640 [Desulfatirhabdiaceae bacterium]
MIIASSDILMTSSRKYIETNQQSERMTMWVGKRPVPSPNARSGVSPPSANAIQNRIADMVTLSQEAKNSVLDKQSLPDSDKTCDACSHAGESDEMDDSVSMMKLLVENIIGRKIRIFNYAREINASRKAGPDMPDEGSGAPAQGEEGWGFEYDYHESRSEFEMTTFSSRGIIKTSDGRQIDFSVDLEMSRTYAEETNLSIRAGDAVQVDPLVINFNGSAAELTDATFSFDLDIDGTEESISFLKPGSGFLVLDKNRDGIVNDGSELFGPATGDGFSELAAYDDDRNNWIDENDAIYDRLSVWTRSESGENQLSSLKTNQVGAIYLSSVETLFDLKDKDNNQMGQIAATGIYADEDGSVKTVQHLNLSA